MKVSAPIAIALLKSRSDIPQDKDSIAVRESMIRRSTCLDAKPIGAIICICTERGKHTYHEDIEGGIWWPRKQAREK